MTDNQTIFLTWIVIFAVAFMGMVAVQEHVQDNSESLDAVVFNGEWLTVNHTTRSTDQYHVSSYRFFIYDNDSKFIVDVPDPVNQVSSTPAVLDLHCFDEWSESDQELLTQMMQVTAAGALGIETEMTFGELASIAPVHVLETYINLLESAGY